VVADRQEGQLVVEVDFSIVDFEDLLVVFFVHCRSAEPKIAVGFPAIGGVLWGFYGT
jgi:hypothetical protein